MRYANTTQPGIFADQAVHDDFTADRIRWLIKLRWIAMLGVLVATSAVLGGFFPGVAWPVLVGVLVAGSVYNLWLIRSAPRSAAGERAAVFQALVDLVLLTLVLWAAGGISSPFVGYYIFHVTLIAILGGPWATFVAVAAAFAGVGFLALTELEPMLKIGSWEPSTPWGTIADVVAFTTTLGSATYVVLHAVKELRDRERALEESRNQAELEYQVISNTLDELEAGLEVVSANRQVQWRNRLADKLAPPLDQDGLWRCAAEMRSCDSEPAGKCPLARARDQAAPGRCRFSVGERVYEMLSFPLASRSSNQSRIMNLYVDRTQMISEERRLLHAERLASLGRVAQGVAHELNTPLATIRTLAADMREAIRTLHADEVLRADLGESAALIRDETERLGRITQALLSGGTLPRVRLSSSVRLMPIVDRARRLVFAGVREGPQLRISSSLDGLSAQTDPDRLLQVLVNLLQNALDASRETGGYEVRLSAQKHGTFVEVSVEDDGPGLDPEIASRLFEPFATTKPPGEGTGLGLYASYMLVQTMGGDLSIESLEGQGVRARVRLPVGVGVVANETDLSHRASRP